MNNSTAYEIIERYREIYDERSAIIEQIKLRKEQEINLDNEIVTRKKALLLPMPSHKKIMSSNLDYQFLGRIMLDSKFGGRYTTMNNLNQRFIYKDKVYELSDIDKLPQVAKDLKISLSTFKRRIRALLNTDLGLVEVGKNSEGKVFYKIRYATDNKYYVTIHNDMLKRLVTSTNSNMIKIYILMRYNLTKPIYNGIGEIIDYKHFRKRMTYDYILEQIGYEKTLNRSKLKDMLEDLSLLGYIRIYAIETPIRKIDKHTNLEVVETVKGYEYELATLDEWLEHTKKSISKSED
ncbi:MAG: hypothetical protein ACRCXT_01755 [Paraclostridium sp.]